MNKIKVCFILPGLSIGGGGAAVFKNIINTLNRDLFDVFFITYEIPTKYTYPTPENVNHYDLKIGRLLKAILPIFKILKRNKFDIVISNAGHVNVMLGFLKHFLPKTTKFVGRESNIFSNVLKDPNENLNRTIFVFFYKLFLRRLDKIICQSKDMKEDLIKRIHIHPSKIEIINNPIINQSLVQTPISKNNVILAVGRLVYQKGFDNLLRIAYILSESGFDFKLKIFGEGAEEQNLKNQIIELNLQEKVFLMGLTDNIGKEYENSAIYVMTSRYEGFPNSLLEAISFGLPCVVFDCPGDIDEIVTSTNGLIIEQDNYKAFANGIIEVFKNESYDKEKIFNEAFLKFNVLEIAKKYEKLFINLKENTVYN